MCSFVHLEEVDDDLEEAKGDARPLAPVPDAQRPSGPVDPSFRALSGRLEFTVRRHRFKKDYLFHASEIDWTTAECRGVPRS